MKDWMPIEAQPGTYSRTHEAHSALHSTPPRRGNGLNDNGFGVASASAGTLSVDAPEEQGGERRPPASPAGTGSIHPAFLPETTPEELWYRGDGGDYVPEGGGTWYGAMWVTCCVVVSESYYAILECMDSVARKLVQCYHGLFRCFIWCGCLCCSAAERRARLDSYDRTAKHEERCMQGVFVRRITCRGNCAVWVPKRAVDQLIFASGVIAMIFLSASGMAVLIGQIRVSNAVTKWTVVDSTSSDAYAAWQGNVAGESLGRHGLGLAPPKTLKFYVWDIQNSENVLASAAKPVIAEIGPVAFRESWLRFDVDFAHAGNVVKYTMHHSYAFDASQSAPGLSLSDTVTNMDMAAVKLRSMFQSEAATLKATIDMVLDLVDTELCESDPTSYPRLCEPMNNSTLTGLDRIKAWLATDTIVYTTLFKATLCSSQAKRGNSPFVMRSIQDILFGSESDVIGDAVDALGRLDDVLLGLEAAVTNPTALALIEQVAVNIAVLRDSVQTNSPALLFNSSGLQASRRYNSPTHAKTGKKDRNMVGTIKLYQNMSTMHGCQNALYHEGSASGGAGSQEPVRECQSFKASWSDGEAAGHGWRALWDGTEDVGGTEGDRFKPASWWFGEAWNKVHMLFGPVKRVLPLTKKSSDQKLGSLKLTRYAIPDDVLSSSDSVPHNTIYDQFGPDGLANLTYQYETDVFVSRPHFLDAASVLQGSLVGLHPNPSLHATYLDVEHTSGLTARSQVRWQMVNLLTDWGLPVIGSTLSDLLVLAEEAVWDHFCNTGNVEVANEVGAGGEGEVEAEGERGGKPWTAPDASPSFAPAPAPRAAWQRRRLADLEAICNYTEVNTPVQKVTACLGEGNAWDLIGADESWGGVFIPYVWSDESYEMTSSTASDLHSDISTPKEQAKLGANVLLGFACVFAVVCLAGLLARVSERFGRAQQPQFGNEDAKMELLADAETEYPRVANGTNGHLNGTYNRQIMGTAVGIGGMGEVEESKEGLDFKMRADDL